MIFWRLQNPLGLDVDPEQILYLMKGCVSADGTMAEGSECGAGLDITGPPELARGALCVLCCVSGA